MTVSAEPQYSLIFVVLTDPQSTWHLPARKISILQRPQKIPGISNVAFGFNLIMWLPIICGKGY